MPFSPFDHHPRTRLIFGNGTLSQIGELTRELGGRRALIVSDPGIVKAGYVTRAASYLLTAGVQTRVYGDVRENPSTEDVDRCVEIAREFQTDFIIGLGGGSSMDTAKGCNFILTNGGRMQDYWGTGKATQPMLPMIAIPTTAGTGSECQSYALISDAETHVKMACGDVKAAAKVAILDPELTVSQPHRVTVCTGVDALSHALETAVTNKGNAWSTVFSREAFRLCHEGFTRILADSKNLEARGQMLLGAAYAGIAIENSMLGAAHSCANPLTAKFHVVHGEAVGVMLPHIIRFNSALPECAAVYASYYEGDLAQRVTELLSLAQMPLKISSYGVQESDLSSLAEMAMKQWTAQFNPRPLTVADFADLYRSAM
ncbi:alcohol dehydrogenase/alcohol dehydrogenase [Prosthecobacter fusiformis]|uniref:Alcohol dehydrogenase/alcohol dehydrogenase n=1 Tax=Prosthecobacter fusiformis TaxID=48464 RepID=A0A4V3FG31_9BACT|nr:iron-containing alcohol dehydrogenase [Prosthecobacter fusiformis]TDU73073.1 alcohol dehydrogenase/alcohol dehydrogenase [Prosthecobacter fusiformis]